MRSRLARVYVCLLFLFSCATTEHLKPREMAQEVRLEVKEAMLVASGRVVEVKYRIYGDTKQLNPRETYIVDELTGEIIFIERPLRLLGSTRQMPFSYIIFPNRNTLIKKGGLITVVIGGLRQEHIRVSEQSAY